MAKDSVARIESITVQIRPPGGTVRPFAVTTVSPGECVTVGPSFNVGGTYSAPDTAVIQCCLMIRPGGTTCAVNAGNLTSGNGTFSASFTKVALGDYYLDVKGNQGGEDITDITVAQSGIGQPCHRQVRFAPSTRKYAKKSDGECSPVAESLTFLLDPREYPSETLIRFGISTPVLPIVTFTFSIPHHLKP